MDSRFARYFEKMEDSILAMLSFAATLFVLASAFIVAVVLQPWILVGILGLGVVKFVWDFLNA